MGKPKSRVCSAFVPGPLEQYAPGFRAWLLDKGYTALTTVPQLQLMAHVSRWLEREGLAAAGRRDHAMLALAVQSGLRVSELTSLTCGPAGGCCRPADEGWPDGGAQRVALGVGEL